MLRSEQIDQLIELVSDMNRDELIHQFETYPAPFPVDFSRDFLERQEIEKLRHVFFGLCMHTGKLPKRAACAA